MKVLLINGSPHRNGCTYTALSEVASELNKENIETEIVQIGVEAIRGCIACGKCKENHKCVFNDEVNEVIEKMKSCDGLIVGSPVYYAAANGSLVSFLNRLFYSAGRTFSNKPGAAIVSARRAGTTAALDELNKFFTISNMPLVPSKYWNMVHGFTPDDVRKDEEGMQTMRQLGRNMAWLLKCIEAGKNAGVELPAREKPLITNFIR